MNAAKMATKKKRWLVSVPVTVSLSVYVRADTAEQAIVLAADAPIQTLCHLCDSGNNDELSLSGIDGDPDFDKATAEEVR